MYSERQKILGISIVILGHLAFRTWNLTGGCLFFDEIFSIHAARHGWQELFWFVAQDLIHPPLFYVLLKIWIAIGGENLLWLKLFPWIFSTISLIPFYFLCKNLKLNDRSILVALSFFAVNGCLIKYAQEVRMYSVLLCFGLFSLWLFVRLLNENKGFGWLILVNVLLVNTHYFGWLIVLTQLIVVIVLQREKLKLIAAMITVTGISFVPWAATVYEASKINADFQQNLGWASKPDIITVFHYLNDLFEPIYFQQTNIERAETIFITGPLILICLTATLFCLFSWKRETETRSLFLILILLKVPIIVAFVASWLLPVSVWGSRHLIVTFPLVGIFFALVLERVTKKELKITLLSISLFIVAFAVVIQIVTGHKKPVWCAWEELSQGLDLPQDSRIYTFEDQIAYHLWFSMKARNNSQIIVVKGVNGLREDTSYFMPRGFDDIQTTNEQGIQGEKFYVVFRDPQFSELRPPLNVLKSKGYIIGNPQVFVAQGVRTYFVKVEKSQ